MEGKLQKFRTKFSADILIYKGSRKRTISGCYV